MIILEIILLVAMGAGLSVLGFFVWVVYTITKSLKDISIQTKRIADVLNTQSNREDAKNTGKPQNCWDEVFTND